MAEATASALLNVIVHNLANKALKEYARSQGIYSELENLGRNLSQIQALLNDASQKEVKNEAVKLWLNDLQHLAYDIDDVLDDVATEAMQHELTRESGASTSKVRKLIPTSCCTKFSLSHRLCPKLDRIATELERLYSNREKLGLVVKDEKQTDPNRGNETSLLESNVIGREGEKEKLLNKLLGDASSKENFSIVPIVGMGGVGKTTLAKLLYNDTQVEGHFELRAWVCVSDEFDIFKISKTMFQGMSGETKEFEDLNQLQMALKEKLKDQRFLLVLDDVWTESVDQWENLVLPFHSGAHGSRIIMTTRKDELVKKLGFDHLDHLESLSHEDALSLFALHAIDVDNFDSHPTLRVKGEGIVEKCGGLPLALKAIGRLLKTKKDEEDWDIVLKSEIWDLKNVDEIIPALRLSYHDLSADLKRLFAYCSLFPKDFLFNKKELVLLWMSEGFLNHSTATKSPERCGHEYFETLLSRSFFQHAPNKESLFVMHDLMNDLATFVSGDFFLRFDNHMEMEKEALEKYHHMSFVREEYVAYPKFMAFKTAKGLRTFLAVGVEDSWKSCYLSNKILTDLLPCLPLLRVLSLSSFEISEVPHFIGSLKHLRYLNLSQTIIKELPETVDNLYNLQTLILFGCEKLTKLPKSFLMLRKLRHLDIGNTPLLKNTPLGIGELKSLRSLTKIIINTDRGFAISELKELNNLRGHLSIEGLRKVQSEMHAHEAKLSLKGLTKLMLDWGNGIQHGTLEPQVLDELKPNSDRLKELAILSYGGIKFPNWVGDPSFQQLVHVSLTNCRNCTSLPPFGQLPILKELFIQGMDEVEVIGSDLHGNTGVAFPSLEVLVSTINKGLNALFPCLRNLHIKRCPKLIKVSLGTLPSLEILRFEDLSRWEVWSTNNEGLDVGFPSLRKLYIKRCPNLVDISLEELPLLRVLDIDGCGGGVFKSLVQVASSITKLEIRYMSGLTDEVWRGATEYLGAVEKVVIWECNEIGSLWESEAHASKVLVKEEGDNFGSNLLSSLRMLEIIDCKSMERFFCPNNIEILRIFRCDLLTSVSFPTTATRRGGLKLKSLYIDSCKKLMGKITNTSMPMLEFIYINGWTNLKSIIQVGNFTHLTELRIIDCPSFESFPDIQMSNLITLEIRDCQSMQSLSDAQLPNLTNLVIENCQSIESFPDTQLLNLTKLRISHCPSMNSLPHTPLQNLTELLITYCKSMKSFPHIQLQSLSHLTILSCESIDVSSHSEMWPPKLSVLQLGRLKKPISEWGPQNFPTSLVDLRLCGEQHVSSLRQLTHLFPSSLTKLEIIAFDKLESLSMGLQHLTSLQHHRIVACPRIKHLPKNLTSLQHLEIEYCTKMKHLPKTLLPSLLRLVVDKCPNLGRRCRGRSSHYWPLISHIPCIYISDHRFVTGRKKSLCCSWYNPDSEDEISLDNTDD